MTVTAPAHPTIEPKPNRSRRISHIRCTADERAAILSKANDAKQSLSEYVRCCALNTPIVPAKSSSRHRGRSKEELDALNELARHVKSVGVNLNQIARRANETGIIVPALPATCEHLDIVLVKLLDEVLP